MNFIDCHLHIRTSHPVRFYNDFNFEQFLEVQSACPSNWSFIMINPTIQTMFCPKDNSHMVCIKDTDKENTLVLYCTKCNKELYRGPDPYRKANLELLQLCREHKNLVPFITLAMSNNTIPYEIEFYENHYALNFCGFKLHPALNMRNPVELHAFNSIRPVIIHSGTPMHTTPYNILDFAKKYKGNVDIAHLACFNDEILNSKLPSNIFFDTSPLSVLLEECVDDAPSEYLKASTLSEKDLKQIVINYLLRENIMFGTDAPFSDRQIELNEIKKYITSKNMSKILLENALKFAGKFIQPFL